MLPNQTLGRLSTQIAAIPWQAQANTVSLRQRDNVIQCRKITEKWSQRIPGGLSLHGNANEMLSL